MAIGHRLQRGAVHKLACEHVYIRLVRLDSPQRHTRQADNRPIDIDSLCVDDLLPHGVMRSAFSLAESARPCAAVAAHRATK